MAEQKDILIFLSDQHDGRVMGPMGHPVVRTPNLDALADEGTLFENAYTTCPLCIPARMSLLTGLLPVHTGVYTNRGSIHPEQATFLHRLAAVGYETVLCGRMHFEGEDQRHGFTKRIADDITPTAISGQKPSRFGVFSPTLTEPGSIRIIGGGNSPTLEYDRYVVNAALEYLSQPHEKPQCIVVGTYAPHFPYVAPPELYEYYLERGTLPPTLELPVDSPYRERLRNTESEIVLGAQAAYWGMIEFEDQCIGQVRQAWTAYLSKNNREGVFVYLSDHGDHAGDRGFYGKQSLYEAAVRIPMIFSGSGIASGSRVSEPVSLLDMAPTICALAGAAQSEYWDGLALTDALVTGHAPKHRDIISEWITKPYAKGREYGRMLRRDDWKLISYVDYPQEEALYRPGEDPWEMRNLARDEQALTAQLRQAAYENLHPEEIVAAKNRKDEGYLALAAFNRCCGNLHREEWTPTAECMIPPEAYLCGG